mmetsp:Transcript_98419/g.175280  ORF Transcript_98419/g.175280 Transcript_98419/m.175280 type:complete len:386 (-) Transcript_98419:132-1289(-)|eukprot:CAMPEP_0197632116 /NCGR_PEP_ID=MMETSP1338-20131121/9022_1 /TAXON_ID=43686 ORGANISM="Pelagodinium beii, Strain RCC1491" /NCGR_SAMPLE_ID=MMETSP1338 /ASSEMBLY_ACC=CAM_ASM_000754 /LENGTH=385 /DNA_ID=CAMNT_0043203667 /DNA_START=11 /DNA_END=1168 /DNA_ORIENTATION=+
MQLGVANCVFHFLLAFPAGGDRDFADVDKEFSSLDTEPAPGSQQIKQGADLATNLAFLPMLGIEGQTIGDKIPGMARCISGATLLTQNILAGQPIDEQVVEVVEGPLQGSAREAYEAVRDEIKATVSANGPPPPITLGTEFDKHMAKCGAFHVDPLQGAEANMYMDVLKKRQDLWEALSKLLVVSKKAGLASRGKQLLGYDVEDASGIQDGLAEDLGKGNQDPDWFKIPLSSSLGPGTICNDPIIHKKFVEIDQKLQYVLLDIQYKYRAPKKGHLLQGTWFQKFDCALREKWNKEHVLSAYARREDPFNGIKEALRSPEAGIGLAAIMLAKSIIMFNAGSVYAACDILGRVADLSSALTAGTCQRKQDILKTLCQYDPDQTDCPR